MTILSNLTFKRDLVLEPFWTYVSAGLSAHQWEQLCQIILKSMHKCTSYGPVSSIYDHFIIWPSCVTLTFNLPEQMFQMAFLLLEENNCAKLFWNPCSNVQVMARINLDGPTHNACTLTKLKLYQLCLAYRKQAWQKESVMGLDSEKDIPGSFSELSYSWS